MKTMSERYISGGPGFFFMSFPQLIINLNPQYRKMNYQMILVDQSLLAG